MYCKYILLETFANSWLSRNSHEVQTKRAGSIILSYYKYFANGSTILFSSGFWRIVQLHKVRYSRVAFKPKDIKRLHFHNSFNRSLLPRMFRGQKISYKDEIFNFTSCQNIICLYTYFVLKMPKILHLKLFLLTEELALLSDVDRTRC